MEENERIRAIYCRWLGAPPPEDRREALWQRIQGELDRMETVPFPNPRNNASNKIEADGSYDGLVAVFGQ